MRWERESSSLNQYIVSVGFTGFSSDFGLPVQRHGWLHSLSGVGHTVDLDER
jgi:hypothetical protein